MDSPHFNKLRDSIVSNYNKLKDTIGSKGVTALTIIVSIVVIVVIVLLSASRLPATPSYVFDYAGDTWQEYRSDEIGYSISLPAGWEVQEEATQSGPDILVSDTNSLAFVRIRGLADPYLNSEDAITSSIAKYEEILSSQEGVDVAVFQAVDYNDGVGGFIVLGEFPVGNTRYSFEEHGVLLVNGDVLMIRAADVPDAFNGSIETMSNIIASFILD